MLTKQDLEAIDQLLDKKFSQQEENFSDRFKELADRIEDLEIKLDEKTSDLNMELFKLNAQFREEVRNIKRTLSKLYKSQETIIGFFNTEHLKIEKRVAKIESHIKLSAH